MIARISSSEHEPAFDDVAPANAVSEVDGSFPTHETLPL
jgi:hypothetical protein